MTWGKGKLCTLFESKTALCNVSEAKLGLICKMAFFKDDNHGVLERLEHDILNWVNNRYVKYSRLNWD
jgi:hypothetical protein